MHASRTNATIYAHRTNVKYWKSAEKLSCFEYLNYCLKKYIFKTQNKNRRFDSWSDSNVFISRGEVSFALATCHQQNIELGNVFFRWK